MAVDRLQLSKLLDIVQRPRKSRIKFIERDAIRSVLKEKLGSPTVGRDFYGDFWADAKLSIVKPDFDLATATADRIKANRSRRNLYPRLLAGFQRGWLTIRDHTQIIMPASLRHGVTAKVIKVEDATASVTVSNLLIVRGGGLTSSVTYPYFSKETRLGPRTARLGLALLKKYVPQNDNTEYAIMDVLRGTAFLASDVDFSGAEDDLISERYNAIVNEWRVQRRLHGGV